MDTKQTMIEFLKQQTELITAQEISDAIHVPRNVVYAMLGSLLNMHGFTKQRKGHYMKYGIDINVPVVEKVVYSFPLPDDMWRGWVNPETGIVPCRLGLADAPPIWNLKEPDGFFGQYGR